MSRSKRTTPATVKVTEQVTFTATKEIPMKDAFNLAAEKMAAALDMLRAELPIQGANKIALKEAADAFRALIVEDEPEPDLFEGLGSDTQAG